MKIHIGETIAALRKEQNITQEKLAAYLQVSPQAVSRWEQGQSYPDFELIPNLALFFGISIESLFTLTTHDILWERVSRYSITHNESIFQQTKELLEESMKKESDILDTLRLFTHLYYQHALASLEQAENLCQDLINRSKTIDRELWIQANMQMVRYRRMKYWENIGIPSNQEETLFHLSMYAIACLKCGNCQEALEHTTKALELYGELEELLELAGFAASCLGDKEKAKHFYSKLEKIATSP